MSDVIKRRRGGEEPAPEQEQSELAATLAAVRKQYGSESVKKGSENRQPDRISTGSFMLDFSLLGGIPINRITMIVGERSGGKSTLGSKIAASAQRQFPDQSVLWLDIEGVYENTWSSALGVDNDKIQVIQCETGEMAVDVSSALIKSKETSLVVVDSLAALIPMKEAEGSAEDALVGAQARMVGGMIRKVVSALIDERKRGHYVTVLFINQFRCYDKEILIWTTRGLMPIGDIQIGDKVESPTGFATVLGKEESSPREGLEIIITKHNPLRMSKNHRHMVVGENGRIKEAFAADIKIGDWVILAREMERSVINTPSELPKEHAAFLGAYFADGCVTNSRVCFGEVDLERRGIVRNLFRSVCNVDEKRNLSMKMSAGRAAVDLIDRYKIGYRGSEKVIPEEILRGSESTIREFLRHASFDTHSFQRNKFYWTFETEGQASCVLSLLRRFNIRADLIKGPIGKYTYLSISADDAIRFADEIGFAEPKKQKKAALFKDSYGARGRYDVVPYIMLNTVFDMARRKELRGISGFPHYGAISQCCHKGLNGSRQRLLEFVIKAAKQDDYFNYWVETLDKYRFSEIQDIRPYMITPVDIEVEGEFFFADGVLTHNSKIGGYGDNRCVHADTLVCFENGEGIPIGTVVEEKIQGNVWSLNERTGIFELRPIIDWHYNGEVEDGEYLSILALNENSRNGVFCLTVTRDHYVLTTGGWRTADRLTTDDYLISKYEFESLGLYKYRLMKKPTRIVDIQPANAKKMKWRGKYDISISQNHNYMVGGRTNGVVIHNSIPGGRAAEYCTSVQFIIKNKEVAGKDQYSVDSMVENEHAYTIQKNKLNAGPRTGEFRLRRVPDEKLGLNVGDIDDASTMLSYAKKFGFYTGGGASWTLNINGREIKFKNAEAAVIHLYAVREDYWALRNLLIREQAKHLGMPDDFLATFN